VTNRVGRTADTYRVDSSTSSSSPLGLMLPWSGMLVPSGRQQQLQLWEQLAGRAMPPECCHHCPTVGILHILQMLQMLQVGLQHCQPQVMAGMQVMRQGCCSPLSLRPVLC
jgi:hypothetical protein